MKNDILDYINKATEEQIIVLEALRELVHESVEDVKEDIKWGFVVFNKTTNFAYLRFSKKHITLGFYNIDNIKDPDNLLEGSGNTLKHIKIFELNEKLKQTIKGWLIQVTNS